MQSYYGHFQLHKQNFKSCGPNCGLSHVARNCKWSCIVWSTWRLSFQNLKVEWKRKSCQCEGSPFIWLSYMPFPLCLTSKSKRWLYVVHTPWGSRTYSAHCPTFKFPFNHEIGTRLVLQAITCLLVFLISTTRWS